MEEITIKGHIQRAVELQTEGKSIREIGAVLRKEYPRFFGKIDENEETLQDFDNYVMSIIRLGDKYSKSIKISDKEDQA